MAYNKFSNLIHTLDNIKSDKVHNYVIAGLDSYLLGKGKVRMFKNSRNHLDYITPHSHRYGFSSLVLQGSVVNELWESCDDSQGDLFLVSTLEYDGEVGKHTVTRGDPDYFCMSSEGYTQGESYKMDSNEIHSIRFSRDAIVLLFEEEEDTLTSKIIEPVVSGRLIKTYENKDYMFLKG